MTFSFKIEGVSDLFVARGGRLFYPVILGKGHWKSYVGGAGGEGNFRTAGIFFRYQIPCMNFFGHSMNIC